MFNRILLAVLGAATVLNGAVMLARPGWWYETVPGVTATGPFNAHLVFDLGGAFALAGVGLLLGAWRTSLWPAAAMGAAFLGFHGAFHLAEMASGHAHGPVGFEIGAVLIPSALAVYAAAAAAMRSS